MKKECFIVISKDPENCEECGTPLNKFHSNQPSADIILPYKNLHMCLIFVLNIHFENNNFVKLIDFVRTCMLVIVHVLEYLLH